MVLLILHGAAAAIKLEMRCFQATLINTFDKSFVLRD